MCLVLHGLIGFRWLVIQIFVYFDSGTEKGDLLIFMSGLNEITTIIDAAKEYADKKNNWIILPLHSSLSIADQDKVKPFYRHFSVYLFTTVCLSRFSTMHQMACENVLSPQTLQKRP